MDPQRPVGAGFRTAALGYALAATIVASNPSQVAPLVAPGLKTGLLINIPQRRLFLMVDGESEVSYPIGLGRPSWPTFVGPFTIMAKEVDPVWDVPASIQEEQRRAGQPVLTQVPPGPGNPLGKYWLGLSVAGYGIHGTNAPASIGRFQTHGCIRMLPADIEALFDRVAVGTPGLAVYEPIVLATRDGELWMEAHPDVYRRDRRDARGYVTIEAARLAPRARIDMPVITRLLAERSGRAERIERRD